MDAGGQGLVYIFEGMLSVFKDNHIIAADEASEKSAKLSTSGAGKGVYTDDLMKVEDIKNELLHPVSGEQKRRCQQQ